MQFVTLKDIKGMMGTGVMFDEASGKIVATVVDTDTVLNNEQVMAVVKPAIEQAIAALPEDAVRSDEEITALAKAAIAESIGETEPVADLSGAVQGFLIRKPVQQAVA